MLFQKEYIPQFREADESGLVGLRGYLCYFQDMATHFMYNLGKGNDRIPEEYGICWMYTKYKLHIEEEADFSTPLLFETWAENKKSPLLVEQALLVTRNGAVLAQGRVESCLYDMKKGCLARLESIEYPQGIAIERKALADPFVKFPKAFDRMEYGYTYRIRYTDLDKSRHMTNLRYVSLLLDVFGSEFYDTNRITDFEIHYIGQCFEGEELRMCFQKEENGIFLVGIRPDGKTVVQAFMQTKSRWHSAN